MTEIGGSTRDFELAIPGKPGQKVRLNWAAVTHVGRKRKANEDSFVATSPMFAVADGMGGHLAGDKASDAVVTRLAALRGDFIEPKAIERALQKATEDIDRVSAGSAIGVGTTVTGAALTMQDGHPYFVIFNIGDSRVYRFERNEFVQVSVDHSLVQQLVELGEITKEQAFDHPEGNVITRAVGFQTRPVPDYWMLPLATGLRLVLCSDGLTGELRDERIRLHIAASMSVEETANALVDAALAEGARDNVTVVIIEVAESPDEEVYENTAPRVMHRALRR
ncbi:MAG: PP2C family protein-serine/threonine phosphatase [Microbacteriaceae bacterium]